MVDRGSRTVSMTLGYGLDPFLTDMDLSKILERAGEDMQTGRYGEGISKLAKLLRVSLKDAHKRSRYHYEKWQRFNGVTATKTSDGGVDQQESKPTKKRVRQHQIKTVEPEGEKVAAE